MFIYDSNSGTYINLNEYHVYHIGINTFEACFKVYILVLPKDTVPNSFENRTILNLASYKTKEEAKDEIFKLMTDYNNNKAFHLPEPTKDEIMEEVRNKLLF